MPAIFENPAGNMRGYVAEGGFDVSQRNLFSAGLSLDMFHSSVGGIDTVNWEIERTLFRKRRRYECFKSCGSRDTMYIRYVSPSAVVVLPRES